MSQPYILIIIQDILYTNTLFPIILDQFTEIESKDRFIWWKFLCEHVIENNVGTSVAVPLFLTILLLPNPDGLIFITSFFPEPSNFWVVWGLSFPFNLLINLSAWAPMTLCVNFLAVFLFPIGFLFAELR